MVSVNLPRMDNRGIPVSVLRGTVPRYRSVGTKYRAILLQTFLGYVNRAYWAKAKRGTDDLGNSWKPLKPKTHAIKKMLNVRQSLYGQGPNRSTKGLLTPSQTKTWRAIYTNRMLRFLKAGDSKMEAEKKAAQIAWNIVKKKGGRTSASLRGLTDTNIRTGRLVASTRPGKVANNRYYTVGEQSVQIRERSIRVNFNVPYFDKVQKERPIIPPNAVQWLVQAHERAIVSAKAEYDRINRERQRR